MSILLEYNRQEAETLLIKIKSKTKDVYVRNLSLDFFEKLDPTANDQTFKYVPIILDFVNKGFIRVYLLATNQDYQESIKTLFTIYDAGKRTKLLKKEYYDLRNTIRTEQDYDKFQKYVTKDLQTALDYREAEKEKNRNKGLYEICYEDENYTFIEHFDETSACYFGRGTLWCTASTKSTNYFQNYKKRGYRIITMIPKKPTEYREKYQMNFPEINIQALLDIDVFYKESDISTYNYLDVFLTTEEYPQTLYNSLVSFIFSEYQKIEKELLKKYNTIQSALIYVKDIILQENVNRSFRKESFESFNQIIQHRQLANLTANDVKLSLLKMPKQKTILHYYPTLITYLIIYTFLSNYINNTTELSDAIHTVSDNVIAARSLAYLIGWAYFWGSKEDFNRIIDHPLLLSFSMKTVNFFYYNHKEKKLSTKKEDVYDDSVGI